MERVRLSAESWSFEPVMRAEGFFEHLLGLRLVDPGSAMLLETASVHGFGIRSPFHAVGLSEDQVVTAVKKVRPWRVAVFPGARYVAELPLDVAPPSVGTRMEVSSV